MNHRTLHPTVGVRVGSMAYQITIARRWRTLSSCNSGIEGEWRDRVGRVFPIVTELQSVLG